MNQLRLFFKKKIVHISRLVYVSTLDGRVSALDLLADGALKWNIDTAPGQMLSSSIQNLELTNNGQWVRMIPSLSGAIYKVKKNADEKKLASLSTCCTK